MLWFGFFGVGCCWNLVILGDGGVVWLVFLLCRLVLMMNCLIWCVLSGCCMRWSVWLMWCWMLYCCNCWLLLIWCGLGCSCVWGCVC